MKTPLTLLVATLLLAACAPQATTAALKVENPSALAPEATGFPMQDGAFTGAPQDFLLSPEELGTQYAPQDAGAESPNSDVVAGRADGEDYIAATGRQIGWRMEFNRTGNGDTPPYIVNVVNTYQTAEGAQLVLSREWHQDVWSLIDAGQLIKLPNIPDLDVQQLVWQDSSGSIGVELVYRNLYILFTGRSEGGADEYQFFASLAKNHLDWIKAHE